MKKLFSSVLAATALAATATSAYAQSYSGAGSTLSPRAAQNTDRRVILAPTPVDTWQYRAVERAAPYVRGTRDCAFGALAGGTFGALRGGPGVGMVTGCAGGLSPNLSPFRPNQAY